MDKVRVNKVTVVVDDDRAYITMYRTNTRLCEFTNRELEVPDPRDSGVDKQTYQSYCKELVIHLLERDGFEKYYWEPKAEVPDNVVRKYDTSSFKTQAMEKVSTMLSEFGAEHQIQKWKEDQEITERYKDMSVKYGYVNVWATVAGKDICVKVEVRSGQMCKPKTFTVDGDERQFNATTIKKLLR